MPTIKLFPALALLCGVAVNASAQPTGPTQPPSTEVMPMGTRATDLRIGTGAAAEPGRGVAVHYTGWLYVDGAKGRQFDSSQGGQPFVFMLGAGQVIPGWDEGVAGMRVGGVRRLIVPPQAGYGAAGAGDTIPPNSTLLFEVELLAVQQ